MRWRAAMTHDVPLAPGIAALLAEQQLSTPPAADLDDAQRAAMIRALLGGALAAQPPVEGLPDDVITHDLELAPGLGARAYRAVKEDAPLLVYFHGGGWVAGSVETVDPFCRLYARAAGVNILSVDYRLAPEHPYPAALDDGMVAVRWARAHAATLDSSPERIALGGDSAGANIAAVLANRLCADGADGAPAWLRALVLSCPVTDLPGSVHASYRENGKGFGLDASSMRWFWRQYAPAARLEDADDADLAPLRIARVPSLPPTLVTTAGYDVLRDEGIAYARKLAEAGVPVTHQHTPALNHNAAVTPSTVARFPETRAAFDAMAAWARAVLHA
jgi:acetyl esterase